MKHLISVGTFNFRDPLNGGIRLAEFDDEDFSFTLLDRYQTDVNAGQQYFDSARSILYVCDECDGHAGENAGGGRVYAFRIHMDQKKAELLNWTSALMGKTCYLWPTASGNYLMAANHTGRNVINKVAHNSDGDLINTIVYEDGGVTLIRLNPDGSLDKAVDCLIYPVKPYDGILRQPHCHSVKSSPDGNMFVTCDKGLDRIYTYRIDEELGRIIPLSETVMDPLTAPRYTCFHPALPVFYENNETSNHLYAFRYQSTTGQLTRISDMLLLEEPFEKMMPSDLVITPDGSTVIVGIRNTNRLVVFHTDPVTGELIRSSITDTGSDSCRGLAVTNDGKCLLMASPSPGKVIAYSINPDGTLVRRSEAELANADNITIFDSQLH